MKIEYITRISLTSWRTLKQVLVDTMKGTGSVSIMIGAASAISFIFAKEQIGTILGNWLVGGCGWNEYLVTVMNMLLNFVTEYLFDTFVVFRGSMDTNDIAKKEEAK